MDDHCNDHPYIIFRNITIRDPQYSYGMGVIMGSEELPMTNITFDGVENITFHVIIAYNESCKIIIKVNITPLLKTINENVTNTYVSRDQSTQY